MRLICVILPLVACNNAALVPPLRDLNAPADDDLAVADLSTPPDLSIPDLAMGPDLLLAPWTPVDPATWCGGPDGGLGCAEDFFARFANCYAPAGYCALNGDSQNGMECRESGAGTTWSQSSGGPIDTYFHGDMLCAIVEIVSPGLFKWTLYDGTTLYEQSNSYMVTCADGTHGNVQACADLNAMFNVLGCPRLPWGAIPCAPPMFPSPSPSP